MDAGPLLGGQGLGGSVSDWFGRTALRLSRGVGWLERGLITIGVFAIFALILANVVTRAIGRPLVWVDEAAIDLMVMTCFVGTSLTVRQRLDFAMTLLPDCLDERRRRVADLILSLIALAYAGFLVWCCWRLFDPVELWRHGFNVTAFTAQTLNFVYTEPTQTLGIPKWVVYLVLPIYALGLTIHCIANLCEEFGWAPREVLDNALAATVEAG